MSRVEGNLHVTSEPVRFRMADCFQLAVLVGAGLTFGVAAAIGVIALAGHLFKLVGLA